MFRGPRVLAGLAGAVAAAAVVAALIGHQSRPAPARPVALQPLVERLVAAGAPGALVLVRDGRGERRAAAGVADLETGAPLRPDMRFRAGSVTKVLTAAVVLQLVAERRLELDDPVERWLPGLLPDGRRITLRYLLAHTSGLYDHADDPDVLRPSAERPRLAWGPERLVALAAARPRSGRPGERFAYSSTNYVILGMVVERATGRPLGEELRRRLVEPLRLRATEYVPGHQVPGSYAHGYVAAVRDGFVGRARPADDRSAFSASWGGAAGAVVSDVSDLATFLRALLDGRVVPQPLLAAMRAPADPSRRTYGLGLSSRPFPCGPAAGHTGNFLGYVTAAFAREDRVVVAMVNAHPLPPEAEAASTRLLDRALCG